MTRVSLNGDRLTQGVGGCTSKSIFATIFENQLDSSGQAGTTLVYGAALAVLPQESLETKQ